MVCLQPPKQMTLKILWCGCSGMFIVHAYICRCWLAGTVCTHIVCTVCRSRLQWHFWGPQFNTGKPSNDYKITLTCTQTMCCYLCLMYCVCVCVCTCMYVCMYVYMYVCMYIYMYDCTCIYMYLWMYCTCMYVITLTKFTYIILE